MPAEVSSSYLSVKFSTHHNEPAIMNDSTGDKLKRVLGLFVFFYIVESIIFLINLILRGSVETHL
uniref:Uncharacterized protein n=1 Tax=Pseudonaja textilis TaxID=8673 RepID=A0A670Z5B4_PSETE